MTKVTLEHSIKFLFVGNDEELTQLVRVLRKLVVIREIYDTNEIIAKHIPDILIEDVKGAQIRAEGTVEAYKAEIEQLKKENEKYVKWWTEARTREKELEEQLKGREGNKEEGGWA